MVTPEHFASVIGQRVKLRLTIPIEGRRRFTGNITQVLNPEEDAAIVIDVDGQEFELGLADMDRARLVPDYSVLPSID